MDELKIGIYELQGVVEGCYGICAKNTFNPYYNDWSGIAKKMHITREEYSYVCVKHGAKMSYHGPLFNDRTKCLMAIKELIELRDANVIAKILAPTI